MSDWLRATGDGCFVLILHVQPGAKKTGCAGLHGDALKIRLAAPPVDGKANAALLQFVAEALGLPIAAVNLKNGHNSRRKVLEVCGSTAEAIVRLAQPE